MVDKLIQMEKYETMNVQG